MKGAFLRAYCQSGAGECEWLSIFLTVIAFIFLCLCVFGFVFVLKDYFDNKKTKKINEKEKLRETLFFCLFAFPVGICSCIYWITTYFD